MKLLQKTLTFALLLAPPLSLAQRAPMWPKDVKQTCTVSAAELNKWFGGSVKPGGWVDPADSVNFKDDTAGDFYKWSWQMFLWTTSPSKGDGGVVFNSDPFYDKMGSVLVPDGRFQLRATKDEDVEDTQATGDALLTHGLTGVVEDDSLIYYAIHVNDVYAFFSVMNKNGQLSPKLDHFPTTQQELDQIAAAAAKNYGVKFEDGEALTMEIKSAWVEVPDAESAKGYITIEAEIPTFKKSDQRWLQSGSKTGTLALVGLHLVGTVAGHKEMVWATFEHVGNAPNGKYSYLAADDTTKSFTEFVGGVTADDYLLIKKGSKAPSPIVSRASGGAVKGRMVVSANKGQSIGPDTAYRTNPWGAKTGDDAANNSDIISVNQSVLKQLPEVDPRSNYVLVGATWTNGELPESPKSVLKGSKQLANTTMETFAQDTNCFDCHQGGGLSYLSHIYDDIKAIKPIKSKKK